jgi:hypothetical protein
MEVGPILRALPAAEAAAVGIDGDTAVVGCGAAEVVVADGPLAFSRLDGLSPGWWSGFCAYDLGRSVERVRPGRPAASPQIVPDVMFIRFAAFAELDRRTGEVGRLVAAVPPAARSKPRSTRRWHRARWRCPTGRRASTARGSSAACARSSTTSGPVTAIR